MSDVNKIFREDESDSGSRIRKISTEDATKALRWINEQEELNSASYLSRGRNADDMSSSWDLHSSTPSVAYVPSNLMQKQGPPGTQQQQQPGGYPYGTGQRPGVFAGFLNPGSGDQEDPNIDQTQQKAMPLPTEQSPAGAAAAAGNGPPDMSRAITFNNSNSNSKNSTQKPTDEPIGYYSWLEYLIYPALAIAIQIIFGRGFAFPDGLDRETGRACISTEGFNSQTPNANMCGLEDTLQTAQAQVRILTPFILAGFVLTTIYLWLGRRQSYQALCSTLKHINMHLASLLPLPVDVTEDESRRVIHARKTLTRWSLLAYELAVLKARGLMDVDAYAIPHLKHFGLLVEGEWEAMVPGDRHTTVLLWMQTKAVKLGNEKIIDPSIHVQTICQAVSLLRDKTNDLMSSLSCDSPIPYTSIVGVLVRYTLLLQAAWKGVEWSIWLYEDGPDIYGTPKMYIDIIILTATSLLFGVLFDLKHILYNPFGKRDNLDIPHSAVGGSIRRTARAFAKGDNLPPSMEPKSSDDAACVNEVETDSGYYLTPPVDSLQVKRHGSLLGC